MSDLTGSRLKVERANEHIANLSADKASLLDSNPYRVTPEFYPEQDFTVFYLDRFVAPPSRISLVAGDAAHNLRSALDLLACTLVRRSGKEPGSQVYFPICETAKKYEAESKRKVQGMMAMDIDAIDLLKPYGGGNNLLWGLHQLDVADKHRLLPTPVISISRLGFTISPATVEQAFKGFIRIKNASVIPQQTIWFNAQTNLTASKQGDPIAVIAGNHELHQDVELTFDIALGEPEIFKGRPILETLVQLSDLVAGIIHSFELP